jgi:hypothetical protein
MAGAGFLILPRVRVLWGDVNLSAYDGKLDFPKGSPVVFDVEVDLQAEGEGPTGSFKWDPTGPGMTLYESFVTNKELMKKNITIEYFYPRQKKVVFYFVWSGQSINYGNDMSITVKLQSRLAGRVNANQRNVAQAYEEKKGKAAPGVYNKLEKQFGLENVISWNKYALDHNKMVMVETLYANDTTFGSAAAQIAKQTGDTIHATSIGGEKLIIFPPYSYKGKNGKDQPVFNAATDIQNDQMPDPSKRYGYIIGPAIFSTIQRETNWKPPQQSNNNVPGTQAFARNPKADPTNTTQKPPANPQDSTKNTAKKTSSPLGTANGRANPGVGNAKNPEGPNRQNALNDEKASKLQMDTLMCPLLVGIKPHDIIFIPSLTGDFMEDWIVQQVSYNQNNGRVSINVTASRIFGNASPMNKTAYDKFLAFAKQRKLVGPSANIDSWDLYAWGKNPPNTPAASASGATLAQTATNLTGKGALSTAKLSQGGIF